MSVTALGADHAGWQLKEDLKAWLIADGRHTRRVEKIAELEQRIASQDGGVR